VIEPYKNNHPVIEPTVFVHDSAVVIGNVTIGAKSSIWPNTTLRGDVGTITIGSETSIQDNSVVHLTAGLSNTVVGNRCTVGHMVMLHGCIVDDACLIGMGSVIMDNAHIGHHSLVGAGSLVLQRAEFPPYSLILGRPAKLIRTLNDAEIAQIESSWQHYVEVAANYCDTASA